MEEMIMFCQKCGSQVPEGSKFCINCGAPVEIPAPAAPAVPEPAQAPAPEPVQVPVQEPVAPQVPEAPAQPEIPVQPQQPAAPQYTQPAAPQQPIAPQYAQPAAPQYQQPAAPQYAPPAAPQYAQPQYSRPAAPQYASPFGAQTPAKKPVNKKLIAIIGGAALAVIAVIVACIFIFGKGGDGAGSAKEVAEKYVKADATYDVSAMFECYPDFMIEQSAEEMDMTVKEFREYISEMVEDMEKVKVKIVESELEDLDDDEIDEIIEEYVDDYDLSKSEAKKVTDAAIVDVEYKLDGEEYSDEICCIKYDGRWYVAD